MPQKLKWLTDKEYRFIYGRVPRFCVDVLIFTKGAFLLSKRSISPHIGLWHFIGGRVYLGESLKSAANRIAKAEAGVKIRIIEPLGHCEIFNNEGPHFHDVSIVFAAKIKSGKIRGSKQAKEIKPFKKIPAKIVPAHKRFLKTHWKKVKSLMGEPN